MRVRLTTYFSTNWIYFRRSERRKTVLIEVINTKAKNCTPGGGRAIDSRRWNGRTGGENALTANCISPSQIVIRSWDKIPVPATGKRHHKRFLTQHRRQRSMVAHHHCASELCENQSNQKVRKWQLRETEEKDATNDPANTSKTTWTKMSRASAWCRANR